MALELQNILDNIDTISKSIDTNVFIKNARDAVKVGIEAYAVEEDEKAKIYAAFEQQLSATVITQIINIAKEIPVIQAQEELYRKQIVTEEKKALDLVSTTTVRDEQSEQDLLLKSSQKTLIDKQATTEEKKALDIEQATELRKEQIKIEQKKQKDIDALLEIRYQDAMLKYQQAKFEESRRYLGIKANVDNMQIRKAMARVKEMSAFMINDSYDVTPDQFSASKTTIDNISTTKLTYTTEVSLKPIKISSS
jgi:hypothetical protein